MQHPMNLIGKIAERDNVSDLSYDYLRDTFENLEVKTLINFLQWINEEEMITESLRFWIKMLNGMVWIW